jgi:thiamine kinase-like enzyme
MVPQEKLAAVTRGLREAFDVAEFEDIRAITKGRTSALVFRIVVKGSPFLLRVITNTASMLGPERQFTCMKLAADAGLAPRIWYSSTEDQISITDFVEEAPFPATEALVRMPRLLRALHALPPFPVGVSHLDTTCMFLLNKTNADGFLPKIQQANILPQAELEEIFALLAQVAAVYPRRDTDMVSSHNDLFKPDNILFDGSRVWLVDWEAAFLNDRYADLAVVANMLVTNDQEARLFLQEYFGKPPDEQQLARFFLARQVARIFYSLVFLWMGSPGEPERVANFQQKFWTGEVNLLEKPMKTVFGKFNREQLLESVRTERFKEALKIVST